MNAEDRYQRARNQVNQMVRMAGFRERTWVVLGLIGASFGYYESWDAKRQIIAAKIDAAKCEPQVLDEDGRRLHAAPMSELEITKVDGIVVSRLTDVVKCIRGLETVTKLVTKCWVDTFPVFVDAGATKLVEHQATEFGSAKQIQDRMARESVEVTVTAWDKPEDKLPGRYWLRWTEQHRYPDGRANGKPETWSGTFDTELVIPDGKAGNWNPLRIHGWSVRRDVVHGS